MSLCSERSDDPIVSVTRHDQRGDPAGPCRSASSPPCVIEFAHAHRMDDVAKDTASGEVMADADDLGDVRPADPGGGAVRMARFVAAMSFARRMAPR